MEFDNGKSFIRFLSWFRNVKFIDDIKLIIEDFPEKDKIKIMKDYSNKHFYEFIILYGGMYKEFDAYVEEKYDRWKNVHGGKVKWKSMNKYY